jgi:16S rRNA processing protein RimM
LARVFPEYGPLLQKGLILRVRGQSLKIAEVGRDKKRWILSFEEKTSLEHVEGLRGADLSVNEGFLPPLQEDEYYSSDLIGLLALDNQGLPYGRVAHVIHPHNLDILIIEDERGEEYLIPLISTYIHKISLEEGVVVFDPSCLP